MNRKNKHKRTPIAWLALHIAQFNDPTRSKQQLAAIRAERELTEKLHKRNGETANVAA